MNKDIKKKTRVYVGLSGGVDSAVSAALLRDAGYDVTGVFIKVWQPDWLECSWKEERRDAMRVAAHLGISFKTLDCGGEYKRGVVDYMIAEYEAGRTPNPDVMCNKTVKFGAFYDWAMGDGAHYVATGHYARIVHDTCYRLLAGVDHNKDQSYFLWTLKQEQLSRILFPVGGLTKVDVRKLARRFKLPNSGKKDSQGLCFIGKIDFKEFLSHYTKTEEGDVLDLNGETIGHHPGALFFTIGERHGFHIDRKTPDDKPYYVIDKDMDRNTITVSSLLERSSVSNANDVRIGNVNWTSGTAPTVNRSLDRTLRARCRYREDLHDIDIVTLGITQTVLRFAETPSAPTPGQSLVIYNGAECLGGGIME